MAAIQPFLLDGVAYNVHVTKLTRKFSVMDSSKSGRTQDGEMYRDIVGTYYNYSMTVASKNGDDSAMDALWEAISRPANSHVCVFPYGQDTLTQRMYITSGEQDIKLLTADSTRWGELSLSFIAMSPKVVP